MAEHLGYDGKHITRSEDWVMVAGVDKTVVIVHELGAAAAIKEAYFDVENSAGTEVIALNKADNPTQFDFTTSNELTLTLFDTNTNGLTPGDYNYGLVLVDQGDLKHEPQMGKLTLLDGYTVDQGTAPHETWTTASTRDAEIDAVEAQLVELGATFDFTYLAAAASASATTITVADDGIFSAADNIRIMLDSGAYDDDVINGAPAANVITLTNPLAGAAAKYNIVRLNN